MQKTEERRRHPRRSVLASVAVFSADRLHGTFRVRDLSAGGARLGGAIALPAGSEVSAVLRLRGQAPFTLLARIVRLNGRGSASTFSLAFVDLSARDEAAIHRAVIASLRRDSARDGATVLVLFGEGSERDALEDQLEILGVDAVSVSTAVEALDLLERPQTQIDTVLVDLTFSASQGMDLLDFVGEHHPRMRRVAMSEELEPLRLKLALRSGRAHAVLRRPFVAGQLGASLSGAALA